MEQQNIPYESIQRNLFSLGIIKSRKKELLDLLSNIDDFSEILSKMKEGKIITKNEHQKILEMIKSGFALSKLNYGEVGSVLNKYMEENTDLFNFIHYYPFVVDADIVYDDDKLYGGNYAMPDELIQIYKDNKPWLVRKVVSEKWEEHVELVFSSSYVWEIQFDKEEYINSGFISIRDCLRKNSYPMVAFFQKKVLSGAKIDFKWRGVFEMANDFDEDGIGIRFEAKWRYSLIYKCNFDDADISIIGIWPELETSAHSVEKWFEEYGSLKIDKASPSYKNIILRKRYQNSELIGIDAFKKPLIGEEKKIDELCRRK